MCSVLFINIPSISYISGSMTKKRDSAGAFCRYNSGRLSPSETSRKRDRKLSSDGNVAGLRLIDYTAGLHRA